VLFPVPPTKPRWPLRRQVGVSLLLAVIGLALGIAECAADRYYSRGLPGHEEGHRRPILFGLWQPDPRDRGEVEQRFQKNIRRFGRRWGQPVWGGEEVGYDLRWVGFPHNYGAVAAFSAGGYHFRVAVVARDTNASRNIKIRVFQLWANGSYQLVAEARTESWDEPRVERRAKLNDLEWQICMIAADQIDTAMRDALE
jgi:hypothetical protein